MALRPITVTQLNEYIGRVLGTDPLLMNVSVQGELSGVKYHQNGHIYFALNDEACKVDCVIWHDYATQLGFELKDGLEVIIRGGINLYKKRGSYSLSVRDIELVGAGDLARAFEEMKARLDKEGLFDDSHKKPLPAFPRKLAIVTSATGAAVKDILKIIKLRNNVVDVNIYPASVQGDNAAPEIARAIDYINKTAPDTDLMIVGRGGGSQDDLWPFNEEIVARSIYASEIPVISAVGHEIDFSISDFVADVRAATPTQAAEIAVPDTDALKDEIDQLLSGMTNELNNQAAYERMKLENLKESLKDTVLGMVDDLKNYIDNCMLALEYNDPRKILEKGYSVLTDMNDGLIKDASKVSDGEEIMAQLAKGKLKLKTISRESE